MSKVRIVLKERGGKYFGVWLGNKVVATSLYDNEEDVDFLSDQPYWIEVCSYTTREKALGDLMRESKIVRYHFG